MRLDNFFKAKSVAIVGVSRDSNKIGHVIFRNFIDGEYKGNVFIVNPNADIILGKKAYKSLKEIKENIDLAIIAVPAEQVLKVIEDCGKKKIKNVIIISSGFKEIGNFKLEEELKRLLNKNKIKCVGVNCLGVFDTHTKIDSLFLSRYRLKRPEAGGISFVCQSGAVGSAILDLAAEEGYGFSKFVSYGNATNLEEYEIIDYLGKDDNSKVICLYVEGIRDGKKFLEVAKRVSRKKPIIVLKAGITKEGANAALSHTGALAGDAEVYLAAFKQAGIIRAESLEEMFNFARLLEKSIKANGKRVQVITNGGGYGILSTDAILKNNLVMAQLKEETKKELRKKFPKIVTVGNPMDLVGDATTERYKIAIESCLNDENVDILLIILLYQTPLISTDVVDVITEFNDLKKKPVIVVSTGGDFTQVLKRSLEENGVSCFTYPENAVAAIKKLVDYYSTNINAKKRRKIKKIKIKRRSSGLFRFLSLRR